MRGTDGKACLSLISQRGEDYMSIIAILLALLMMLLQGVIPTAQTNREAKVPEEVIVSEHTEAPTVKPTAMPSNMPTGKPTAAPTVAPTEKPTAAPTSAPSEIPSAEPTSAPTEKPTAAPTVAPTEKPTATPTPKPTSPHSESYDDHDGYAGEEDML